MAKEHKENTGSVNEHIWIDMVKRAMSIKRISKPKFLGPTERKLDYGKIFSQEVEKKRMRPQTEITYHGHAKDPTVSTVKPTPPPKLDTEPFVIEGKK